MVDYRRLLRLAGLDESQVNEIAERAEEDDLEAEKQAQADQRVEWEKGKEKLITMIARQTGVDLWDSFPINITDDGECEVKIDTGSGMPLAHLLHFANKIAAAQLGSDLQIHGSADLFLSITFKLV